MVRIFRFLGFFLCFFLFSWRFVGIWYKLGFSPRFVRFYGISRGFNGKFRVGFGSGAMGQGGGVGRSGAVGCEGELMGWDQVMGQNGAMGLSGAMGQTGAMGQEGGVYGVG